MANTHWWITRGETSSQKGGEESEVFDQIDNLWGKEVVHLWDRGFAGNPWLTHAFLHVSRFILRWPKNYQLLGNQEQLRKTGEISKAKRSWDNHLVWAACHHCEQKTSIIAFPILRSYSPPTSVTDGFSSQRRIPLVLTHL